MGLVSHHAIGHMGGATYLLCMLENPDDFKNVQVAFAEANGKVGTPEPPTDPQPAILPGLHPSRPWKVGS